MELSVLDSQFRRSKPIENWNSLAWTERYNKYGDFELVSNHISQIMTLLPVPGPFDPPVLVALGESDVPMVVETRKLEKPKNGTSQIVVTGRSFETVLNQRVTIRAITSGEPRIEWNIEASSAAIAAYTAAKTIVVDGAATPLDVIPEINLLNAVTATGTNEKFPVEPKKLYDWMLETLALDEAGIRSTLPIPGVDNRIAVTIYKGEDKRQDVVFDVALEQMDETAYLLSSVGYENVMITSTTHGMEMSHTGVNPSGLARRVDYQDISEEVTLVPGADLTNLTINKGKVALADRLPTALFSGGVAAEVGQAYDNRYFLGDIVKLSGEYGLSQDARVVEFIRTQDQTGIKSYPTFEAVTL